MFPVFLKSCPALVSSAAPSMTGARIDDRLSLVTIR